MDYKRSIIAPTTPEVAFKALTEGIPTWWTTQFTGSGKQVNDVFGVRFDGTAKKFKVTDTEPSRRVTWECLEAYIDASALKNKGEWVGTHMKWDIQPEGNQVRVTLSHEGLTPSLECYQICEQGWDYFILESLQPLLNGKKAQPFKPAAIATGV